jgi:unsaturated rhamnogalacturonyl hydrolase
MEKRTLSFAIAFLTLLAISARADDSTLGQGKVVALDYYFNHQVQNCKQFHYIWDDTKNSGFSKFGKVWEQFGATITKLETAPTADDLKKFSVYIICNPSTEAKAADHKPNYMTAQDADAIEAWVKSGGVLLLMENDKNNSEFEHFNILASRFGMTYNPVLRNTVVSHPTPEQMKHGTFFAPFPDHPIFKDLHAIYQKEICTLTVTSPAEPLLVVDKEPEEGAGKDVVMATAKVSKGLVLAACDPWVYNEYIDVKAEGLQLENRKGAENLCRWLLENSSPPQEK